MIEKINKILMVMVLFLKKCVFVFFIFSDHSIHMAYLGFHKLLYFECRVFLALNVFSYYKKDTQRNQNKVININQWNKYCLLFLLFKCVTSKVYHIGRISSINC